MQPLQVKETYFKNNVKIYVIILIIQNIWLEVLVYVIFQIKHYEGVCSVDCVGEVSSVRGLWFHPLSLSRPLRAVYGTNINLSGPLSCAWRGGNGRYKSPLLFSSGRVWILINVVKQWPFGHN